MAITKPPVLPAWADAGDKVQPSNAELSVGWPVSSTPPSRQRFNWVLNFVANAVRYFSRRGLVDYDAAETYMTGDRVIGDDGKTYRSMVDTNTAQTPSTSPTKWERWGFSQSDLGANAQTQPYTAFTTTGATGAFVLTPSPAIAAYAANQRFRVKFHAVGNGSDTINVSGLGTKSIKQYDRAGAKVSAVITANQLADVEYDGVDFVILDPLPVSGVQVFTANGTFTVPTGVSRVFVTLVGGGGGGAGSINGAPYTGGGGGGGGVVFKSTQAVTTGQAIAVTIGIGGAAGIGSSVGGSYANSNGSAGGTTSFGALVSVAGGGGGRCQSGDAGGGLTPTTFSSHGGSGDNSTMQGGGGGGGTLYGAPRGIAGHSATGGSLYGGGGSGGRGNGYWENGGAGAAGLCIVEW